MGLSQSMFAGISGLTNHQTRMNNLGNNLANINTPGFKRGVYLFSNLLSQTLSTGQAPTAALGGINPMQVGLGVQTASIVKDFSQGGLETTGNPFDMAIEGSGFFVVERGDSRAYTRDGAFHLGSDNILTNSSGWKVQGTLVNAATGNIPTPSTANVEDVLIPIGQSGGVRETSQMSLVGNLNSQGDVSLTGSRMQSVQLFTRICDGSDLALDATTPLANRLQLLAGGATTVRVGDQVYIEGTGVTSGLYSVTAVNLGADQIDVTGAAAIAGGLNAITVHTPAQRGSNLLPQIQGSGGTLQGVYTENGSLLFGNAATEPVPFSTLTAVKGDRVITETFYYGNPATPTGDPDTEFNGTTVVDFTAFLEDILGINAAADPDNDRPEIPHTIPVGDGGDDGVRDFDDYNEARVVFGRGGAVGGIGSITGTNATLSNGGARLNAAVAGELTNAQVGDMIYAYGGGITDGYYQIRAVNPNWVDLGDAALGVFDSAGADGTTGISWQLAPNRIYLNGNRGEDNDIISVNFASGSSILDLFENGRIASANGESAVTSTLVYDSVGNAHQLDITLTLVSRGLTESTWRWYAEAADDSTLLESVNPAPPPPVTVTGRRTDRAVGWGDMVFDTSGTFLRAVDDGAGGARTMSIDMSGFGAATPMTITPDFSALTQFATNESIVNVSEQDGFPPGTLDEFNVQPDGLVNGIYSNGVIAPLARIALATFANTGGLLTMSNNLFREGVNSGEAIIATALSSGMGSIRGGTLELSNVDLSEEFTDLIITQRGFQANARTISASDEMLIELLNITR